MPAQYGASRNAVAGRPRKDGKHGKGVTHLPRPVLKPRFPVHVTSMKWPLSQAQISAL